MTAPMYGRAAGVAGAMAGLTSDDADAYASTVSEAINIVLYPLDDESLAAQSALLHGAATPEQLRAQDAGFLDTVRTIVGVAAFDQEVQLARQAEATGLGEPEA